MGEAKKGREMGARATNEWRQVDDDKIRCPFCTSEIGEKEPGTRVWVRRQLTGIALPSGSVRWHHKSCGGHAEVRVEIMASLILLDQLKRAVADRDARIAELERAV